MNSISTFLHNCALIDQRRPISFLCHCCFITPQTSLAEPLEHNITSLRFSFPLLFVLLSLLVLIVLRTELTEG